MNNKLEVIGIDHGWSMMKTISQVFVTGVKEITTTPALFGDVLEYEGKYYNGMNFCEYMGKKLHFMFGNKALTYVSTEGETIIKTFEMEQNGQVKKKGKKTESEITTSESVVKKQEEFEEMKKKTRNIMFGLATVFVLAVAGVAAYKAMH